MPADPPGAAGRMPCLPRPPRHGRALSHVDQARPDRPARCRDAAVRSVAGRVEVRSQKTEVRNRSEFLSDFRLLRYPMWTRPDQIVPRDAEMLLFDQLLAA